MFDTEYFNTVCDKCFLNANNNVNKDSTNINKKENDYVPKINEYNLILNSNYNVVHLKYLSKHYKLKVTGNKLQLIKRIYTYLYLSFNSVKIQKIIKGFIQRKYNKCHGPAIHNRRMCTNNTDFYTMDELNELPVSQFFSFKDVDGFIYGFDLMSFYNLIYKTNGQIKNPYNRLPISDKIINDFNSLIRISKILKIPICVEIKDISSDLSKAKNVELKAVALFQSIDALGNYSDSKWFMNLNRTQLIKMFREIIDIWSYRAHLTIDVKRSICPPHGNPFPQVVNFHYLHTAQDLDDVRKYILNVLEKLVLSGVDKDNKCLGAYYVLGALTLVSVDAAIALPWLYQALTYI
jgi:hypothetical protein